jgi:hypothetical protein
VSHETPEFKQQSVDWRHTSSPTKTKFKQTTSTQKIIYTMFWDRKGFLQGFRPNLWPIQPPVQLVLGIFPKGKEGAV